MRHSLKHKPTLPSLKKCSFNKYANIVQNLNPGPLSATLEKVHSHVCVCEFSTLHLQIGP